MSDGEEERCRKQGKLDCHLIFEHKSCMVRGGEFHIVTLKSSDERAGKLKLENGSV
jgi:hypothetical protein